MKDSTILPRPFFAIAVAFISGIVLSDYLLCRVSSAILVKTILFISSAVILLFISCQIIKTSRQTVLPDIFLIILCLLGGSFRLLISNNLQGNHIAKFQSNDVPVYLEGVVIKKPIYYQPRKNEFFPDDNNTKSGYFIIKARRISWADETSSVSGKVRVSFYGWKSVEILDNIRYGVSIRILGRVYSPRAPTNPAEKDYSKYLKREGIYKTIRIKSPEHLTFLKSDKQISLWSFLETIRDFLSQQSRKHFSPEHSSFLQGILLGERDTFPADLETKFMRTGTIHYLTVSGLHLAMFIAFMFFILSIAGIKDRVRAISLIAIALFYALLTGLGTPVTRALIIVTIYLSAEVFNRKSNSINSLSLSALLITLYNPNEVFSVGFQLSFLSVLSIITFIPILTGLLKRGTTDNYLPSIIPQSIFYWLFLISRKYLLNAIALSISVWFGIFLIILHQFNIITPVVVLANLILLPIIFFIMVAGFILLPLLSLDIYSYLVPFESLLVKILDAIVGGLEKIPFGYFYLPDIPVVFIWVFYLGFFLYLIRHHLKFFRLRYFVGLVVIFVFGFFIYLVSQQRYCKTDGLFLTMLDVKQGAAFVIQTPERKTLIYDAGTIGVRDVGEQVIAPFLWKKGITTIDYLILSHSHLDHINGVKSLSERFRIKKVISSPYFSDKRISFLSHNKIPIERVSKSNKIYSEPNMSLDILGPPGNLTQTHRQYEENDLSLVLKIAYKDKSIILAGDIQANGIEWLIHNMDIGVSADVFQIPHHGLSIKTDKKSLLGSSRLQRDPLQASKSYIEELLIRINPKYVLINADGSKIDDDILETCQKMNIEILSNHRYGAVTIKIKDKIEVENFLSDAEIIQEAYTE
jgi:competence protein ComEC